MIYLLFAIAAFMAVVTAYIINKMTLSETNHKKTKKVLVILISISLFIIIANFIIQQNTY
jgi:hypothetical protein